MDSTRDKFLTGSRLAQDEHARSCGCHDRHQAQRISQRGAVSHDLFKLKCVFTMSLLTRAKCVCTFQNSLHPSFFSLNEMLVCAHPPSIHSCTAFFYRLI